MTIKDVELPNGIDDTRLAVVEAERDKIANRYRKLQRDVSRYINLLAHTDYIDVSEGQLLKLFDDVREGKI
jgi:hypothetical protein